MAIQKLFASNTKTGLLLYPKPKDVLADITGTKGKLLPFLSFDAAIVQPQFAGTRLHYILADVSVPPLHFALQDGKCALQEPIKDLRKITDLSEIDATPAFLTTVPDYNERLMLDKTLEYNTAGELIAESDARGLNRRTYTWAEVADKRLPVRMDKQFLLGNQPKTESITFHLDATGFPAELTYEKAAVDFEYKEVYNLTQNKKGQTIVTTPQRKDWQLIVTETEQTIFVEYDRVQQGYSKANGLAKVVREYVRSAFRDSANALAYEAIKEFTFDMEADADGLPVSLTARYKRGSKSTHFGLTRKQDGDVENVMRNEDNWMELTHGAAGTQIQSSFSYPHRYAFLNGTVELLLGETFSEPMLWWRPLPGEGPQRVTPKVPVTGEAKLHQLSPIPAANGDLRVFQRFVVEREKVTEHCELRTGEDMYWEQSDESPNDPDGKPMQFISQMTSDYVFGSYYLFWSPAHQLMAQVFQCT